MEVDNIYAGGKLKVEPDYDLSEYKIGDKIFLPNGIYAGHEGFIVVVAGILIAKFPEITTKWGDLLNPKEILEGLNPCRIKNENKKD